MKLYKYTHFRRGYDDFPFEENGYVFAENDQEASNYIMEEHYNEGNITTLEETHIIVVNKTGMFLD